MNIVFMGTPDFAMGVLKSLYDCGQHNIVAVITQPDRPKGRSDKMIPSPVKQYAVEKGLEVFQPVKIKTEEAVEKLKSYDADIFVVAAFGQILSKEILDMPRFGCVNVHASLLPEYRGAAPIQWSIADGKECTGVTIMQMNEGLDTGDIISQSVVKIEDDETGESLFNKLMDEGAKLLVDTLPLIESNSIKPVPQDNDKATYAKILKKEMGYVDFSEDSLAIEHRIRAFTPWPGGYTYFNGKLLKLKKVKAFIAGAEEIKDVESGVIGEIVKVTKDVIYIACKEGILAVYELQAEGKKSMSTHDFLLGNTLEAGQKFGE